MPLPNPPAGDRFIRLAENSGRGAAVERTDSGPFVGVRWKKAESELFELRGTVPDRPVEDG